jgi:hypothetical protein
VLGFGIALVATFRRKKEDREQVLARVEPDGRS